MTKQLITFVALTVFAYSISGCGADTGASVNAGKKTVDKYFSALAQKDLDKALSLYAASFYQKTPKEQWRETLTNLEQKRGPYQGHDVLRFEHKASAASGAVTTVTYQVRYEKEKSTEKFTFRGGDEQISDHQIDVKELLAPAK